MVFRILGSSSSYLSDVDVVHFAYTSWDFYYSPIDYAGVFSSDLSNESMDASFFGLQDAGNQVVFYEHFVTSSSRF